MLTQRPVPVGRRRAAAAVVSVRADATARVRGEPRRVQRYLADLRNSPSWWPGTKSAVKLGNGLEPVRPGSKFELQREMLGLQLPMSYEVVELEPGKRLVLSGRSEHHTQLDQFYLMADRHDAGFCCVRYIADVRLKGMRAYVLQPLAQRYTRRGPEDAMTALQRGLNGAASPIYSAVFEQQYRAELRGGGGNGSSSSGSSGRGGASGGGSRGGSRAGTTSNRGGAASASASGSGGGTKLGGGWLRDLLSGSRSGSGSATASPTASAEEAVVVLDPMGYYQVLGLAPHEGGEPVDDAAIKAAYRRLALQLHPDRHAHKGEPERRAAAERFARLLKAYDALRDAETRALYNAGQLMEATLNL